MEIMLWRRGGHGRYGSVLEVELGNQNGDAGLVAEAFFCQQASNEFIQKEIQTSQVRVLCTVSRRLFPPEFVFR